MAILAYIRNDSTHGRHHAGSVSDALHIKGMPGRHWATIAELAEPLQTVHHGAVTLVSRCEAPGFVERRQSRTDRRQVEIRLLPYGEQCLKRVAERHRGQLKPFKEAWLLQFDGTEADAPRRTNAGSHGESRTRRIPELAPKRTCG